MEKLIDSVPHALCGSTFLLRLIIWNIKCKENIESTTPCSVRISTWIIPIDIDGINQLWHPFQLHFRCSNRAGKECKKSSIHFLGGRGGDVTCNKGGLVNFVFISWQFHYARRIRACNVRHTHRNQSGYACDWKFFWRHSSVCGVVVILNRRHNIRRFARLYYMYYWRTRVDDTAVYVYIETGTWKSFKNKKSNLLFLILCSPRPGVVSRLAYIQ